MAVITLTDTLAGQLVDMRWGQQRFDMVSRSMFGAQALEFGVPLWTLELVPPPATERNIGPWKALLLALAGQLNQLEAWDPRRPIPLGTMRGVMTLSAAAAQGATALSITAGAGQAGKTLLAGDMLQLGSGATQQVVMVVAGATASGTGVIGVDVQPPLRTAFGAGAAVLWDKPKALFRRADSASSWQYAPGYAQVSGLSLLEDWRP